MSAIPIAGDLVPASPARGLAMVMAAATVGRAVTTIPATWLYDRHGISAERDPRGRLGARRRGGDDDPAPARR